VAGDYIGSAKIMNDDTGLFSDKTGIIRALFIKKGSFYKKGLFCTCLRARLRRKLRALERSLRAEFIRKGSFYKKGLFL